MGLGGGAFGQRNSWCKGSEVEACLVCSLNIEAHVAGANK